MQINFRRTFNLVITIILLAIIFYIFKPFNINIAKAELKDMIALHLAMCVISECDHCRKPMERDAIGWCLKKQAWMLSKPLSRQIVDYCAMYKRKTLRAQAIFDSGFETPLYGNAKLWSNTKNWAESFLDNPPLDPEPLADQWGGRMDTVRAVRLGLTRVAGPPDYVNTFWRSKHFASVNKKWINRDR